MLRNTLKCIALLFLILLSSSKTRCVYAWNPADWWSSSGDSAEVGTAAWWKKHKKTAEFVPGEGFRVEGVAGFFDDKGRPIQAQVSKIVKEEEHKGLLNDARVVESVDGIKNQLGLGPDQKMAQQSYSVGEDLFRRQEYHKAASAFKEALARADESQIKQDAMFYLAESHFFANEYPDAVTEYQQLLKEYSNSPHLDKVIRRLFAVARYWEKHNDYEPHWPTTPNLTDDTRPWFDTVGNAIKVYESIRLNDPTGPLADDAVMATANSYFLRGRFQDADYHYKLLRDEYPQSDHQFEAHILGLRCKLSIYQGPNYDGAPLEEAKKLIKQLKQQFGGRLSEEERERLAVYQAQLNEAFAEREYSMAQYYDETEHYGSARFYYARVAREYPDSELAKKAGTRFHELDDKPDHPETSVQWFLSMFPENAERKTLQQVPMLEPLAE